MSRTLKLGSDEQRIVWGEVYAPDFPDSDNDFMDQQTICKMAYGFMRNLRLKSVDSQHNNDPVEDVCVVESFIARKGDPDFLPGAWVVGVHVPDDGHWAKVKSGEYNSFSLEALVTRKETEIEIDIPPVVRGLTTKADDGHEHEFFVSFNEQGEFLGGRTSAAGDGHAHPIRRGTLTEEAQGHSHRFSFMEHLES